MTNFDCACPAIQRGQGSGFLSEDSSSSLLVWSSSGGSGETARMRRLAWTFAARIDNKNQIRLTRPNCFFFFCLMFGAGCWIWLYRFLIIAFSVKKNSVCFRFVLTMEQPVSRLKFVSQIVALEFSLADCGSSNYFLCSKNYILCSKKLFLVFLFCFLSKKCLKSMCSINV